MAQTANVCVSMIPVISGRQDVLQSAVLRDVVRQSVDHAPKLAATKSLSEKGKGKGKGCLSQELGMLQATRGREHFLESAPLFQRGLCQKITFHHNTKYTGGAGVSNCNSHHLHYLSIPLLFEKLYGMAHPHPNTPESTAESKDTVNCA